jgi:dinuclear metal center YbgI/SA1388 family protein
MKLSTVTGYLDGEFDLSDFNDSSHNGLQVENAGDVQKICFGVDASLGFFEEALRKGADMVVCHHGISWGDSLKRITGINYKRISFLARHNMALYACHLPLDAHPKIGNNALIARALGLARRKRFGMHYGSMLGYEGTLIKPVRYETFKKTVSRVMKNKVVTMDFGKKTVKRVAVVSGGAASDVDEAGLKKVDVFVSGEPTLASYSVAQEHGINAVFAGHYATEVWGVRALADVVAKKLGVATEFIDMGISF